MLVAVGFATGEYFTRRNSNKVTCRDADTNCGIIFLSNRIVNMWSSFPDYVIMSDTVNTFKNRLDAHWKHRNFLFHYRATHTP